MRNLISRKTGNSGFFLHKARGRWLSGEGHWLKQKTAKKIEIVFQRESGAVRQRYYFATDNGMLIWDVDSMLKAIEE